MFCTLVEMTFPMSRGLLLQKGIPASRKNWPQVEMTFPMSRGLLRFHALRVMLPTVPLVEMTFPMSRGLLHFHPVAKESAIFIAGRGNDLPGE